MTTRSNYSNLRFLIQTAESCTQLQLQTSTSTLFHKTIGYNRLALKIAIANLGRPVAPILGKDYC